MFFWAQRSTERPTEESLRLDRQIERVTVAANYEMSTMPNNCQPIGLLTYSRLLIMSRTAIATDD